jgi:uncharacterized protein YndB with AHSA1/START domain
MGGLDATRTTGTVDVQGRSGAPAQISGTRRAARRALHDRDSAAGRQYIGEGTFREVRAPEKLVFTWSWRRLPEKPGEYLGGESVVTVELFDRGAATEMRFTHAVLESGEIRESTRTGWLGCFEALAGLLKGSLT